MNTENLDIVYCLKNGVQGDELRYSLRSLENLPHRNVWIYGGKPNWICNVRHVPFTQTSTKWQNSTKMIEEACRNNELSANFIWFNDDFFVLKPITKLEYWHDRTLYDRANDFKTAYQPTSRYGQMLISLGSALRGNGKPIKNYALHIPIIFNRKKFLKMCEHYPDIIHGRSLYANEYEIPSTQHKDVKIYSAYEKIPANSTFVSTSDASFARGEVGKQLKKKFPNPCKYEIPKPIIRPTHPPQGCSATPFFKFR